MKNGSLILNGKHYDHESLIDHCRDYLSGKHPGQWKLELYEFILSWLSDADSFSMRTSGSTGTPRKITFSRENMIASAERTITYFNLKPGHSILLALPVRYVAGKMVVVRAMVGGLDLVTVKPSSDPVRDSNIEQIDFSSFVPYQIETMINSGSDLNRFGKVLIGGARISEKTKKMLNRYTTEFFESYGMTETLSHVAIRKLSPVSEPFFKCLPGISVSRGTRGRIVLHGDTLPVSPLETEDIGIISSDKEFQLSGRIDDVINTGGVKVLPESVEMKLEGTLNDRAFIISKEKDDTFGEIVILVIEGPILEDNDLERLKNFLQNLDFSERPKKIVFIPQIPRTLAGKLIRNFPLNKNTVLDLNN